VELSQAGVGAVMMTSSCKTDWTEEETSTLVNMWPKATATQIAKVLRRSRQSVANKAGWMRRKGLLEMKRAQPTKKWQSRTPLKPDKQDFEAVKMDYCRQHQITVAELSARFEQDDQLVAKLYRLAQVAKRRRLSDNRLIGLVGVEETPAELSLHMGGPALSAGPNQP
jgi:hypothetical protein